MLVTMATVNIYLPDELAERVRAAGINVSATARQALEAATGGPALKHPLIPVPDDGWVMWHKPSLAAKEGRGWRRVAAFDADGKPLVASPTGLVLAENYLSGGVGESGDWELSGMDLVK